jgi:hypothetical protein
LADRLLPNWLEAYLVYTASSESPEQYHLWTGISAIAGALRRRVFFDHGYFNVYPNFYVVLVGPAGRCKKSTAMRLGRGVLAGVPGIELSVDSITRERMIQDLSQAHKDGQSAMTAYSSEFASLLTSSGMDMVVFLTDIFDCPTEWAHKTKSGGTNTIKAPFLNLEGATTPDWISRAMPLDTVGIGLTSRIVFVFEDTPREAESIPELTIDQVKLLELLKLDLASISNLSGEFKFEGGKTGETYKFYDSWYRGRINNPNPTNDPKLNGYFERKPIHMLKLAMIISASQRDDLLYRIEDIQHAMQLLENVEERMPRVFASVGRNPINADREAILSSIYKEGGLTLGQLLERFSYSLRREELSEALDTLMSMEVIRYDGTKKQYVPNV